MGNLISSLNFVFMDAGRRNRPPGLLALKQIIESTSSHTGEEFFKELVRHLAEVLEVHGVWVTEYWSEQKKLNALAFWVDGDYVAEYLYNVTNTPCEPVLSNKDICHVPQNVIELYPDDPDLKPLGAVSYMGISLQDIDGSVIGHLALLDNKPMPEIPEVFAIFKIFASRAAAELRRLIAHRKIEESEARLNRIVNGTSDYILEADDQLIIAQANESAQQKFSKANEQLGGTPLKEIFNPRSYNALSNDISKHENLSHDQSSFRITDSMVCMDYFGKSFPVEISISRYHIDQKLYYLFHIRDITQQVSDHVTIKRLDTETAMLKEQVSANQFNYIIGNCKPIGECLELVKQVAPTGANVLIQGETGTGKELFAKAIHESSARSDRALVSLNCAALPEDLIESELFGHVKGAFTGAISAREGRFSLSDGGTLFLDEVAELPLSLQAKLLRVIQEGTFEQVGSSETLHVNVRIIAATHRDLKELVDTGKFREDLYYRLNVFPMSIPPLRDRGADIMLLAQAFLEKLTKSQAIAIDPFSPSDVNELLNYHWPGNVRELQNIVERGIITSNDGKFRLGGLHESDIIDNKEDTSFNKILSFEEIRLLERDNIIRALNRTNWKIAGEGGASELLKIPRTTLASKIKKLGIKKVAEQG